MITTPLAMATKDETATVPTTVRLEQLARKFDVLAAFRAPIGDDLDNASLHQEHLDSAAACRAVIAARKLADEMDDPNKGPFYGNEVAIWLRAIVGSGSGAQRG